MSDTYRDRPILYVDDEPHNLLTLRYLLGDEYTLFTASSGAEAISVLEQEDIAVLLCDQRMPGMTGVDVCRRARELKPDVVRIIVTAYTDLEAAISAINDGQVSRYVRKPWHNEELIDILRTSIELSRLQSTVRQMQARVLRGREPAIIEAVSREIARELRDPVAALQLNAEQVGDLLEAGVTALPNANDSHARTLLESAERTLQESWPPIERLTALTNRLDRGQRLAPVQGEPMVCDVARVVRATFRMLAPTLEPAVRLRTVLEASPIARIEATDLGQILINLVLNAAQALETTVAANRTVVIHVREEGPMAVLEVSDEGPGMSEEVLARAFDPRFTTRGGSAGLGLSVVAELAAQAGGSVELQSAAHKGATLTLRLPRV